MIYLRVDPGVGSARALTSIKMLATDHPGNEELTLLVGDRELALGVVWRYSNSAGCRAALAEHGELVDPLTVLRDKQRAP